MKTIRPRLWLNGLEIAILGLILFGTGSSYARTEILTLEQAVALALKADHQIRIDGNSLEQSKLAVKKAALDIFPQATIDSRYQYQTRDDTYPRSFQIIVQETIPTSFNLYGEKMVSDIGVAMWEQVIAEATLQIAQAEVIYDTHEAYFEILKCQQLVHQYEQAVANYQKENALALEQLRLGKITKPDQLEIENYLNKAEYNLEKGRSDLEIGRKKLANQIGVKDLSGYRLEEVVLENEVKDDDLTDLQQQALQKRLELQIDVLNIKKARQTLAQANNDRLPTASFSYNDRSRDNYFGISYDLLNGEISWLGAYTNSDEDNTVSDDILFDSSSNYFGNDKRYFTLKLSWTFDFGAKSNLAKQAQYSLENSELTLAKDQQDILLEVEQGLADYQLAIKAHEVDAKTITFRQKSLEIKRLQKELNAITVSDFYDALQDLLEAEVAAIESRYNRILALQNLKKVVGDLYLFDHSPVMEENDGEK